MQAVIDEHRRQAKDRPWEKFEGTWAKDDPLIEEWKQAVEEYRRKMDEDEAY
jgi:hypothetical protein